MRLSKKTEYAMRALIFAGQYPVGTTFQIKDLAEKNGIPKKFLELILLELRNAGIVESRRGVGGGYLMSRRPEGIAVAEIIRAIEGDFAAAGEGHPRRRVRGDEASPAVSRLVREISGAVEEVLSRWSLADLVKAEQEGRESQGRDVTYHI